MTSILFLNHSKSQCGVYNYGIRIYNIWKQSCIYQFDYHEVSCLEEYQAISFMKYRVILYNYHVCTMPWLNISTISKNTCNIGILHESYPTFFNYCINTQSDIPRPIFSTIPTSIITKEQHIIDFITSGVGTNIPIIGSFGFGFNNKGFDKIVHYVNQQFDEAIIKIVMPFAQFGDSNGESSRYISSLCNQIHKKDSIKIMIIHDFLHDDDMLYFLKNNTINLFLYDTMPGRGISSTIDFALSTNTPIGISDSYMFRHIYHDSICVYKTPISQCILNSSEHILSFKNTNSPQQCRLFIEHYLNSILHI